MPIVDLSKVSVVEKTYTPEQCNKYLKAGWALLDTASGVDEQGMPLVMFVVGWAQSSAPIRPA